MTRAPPTQVESGLAVQQLKPTVDLIKRRYGDDKARIQKETAALYEKTGVNPLAGKLCDAQSPELVPRGLQWSMAWRGRLCACSVALGSESSSAC